jgi:hypothetical protein
MILSLSLPYNFPPPLVRLPLYTSLPPERRKVLLCSARGLKRLQRQLEDSLPSNLSSLYINQHFEDGVPCPVKDCPLNPSARVRPGRQDELTPVFQSIK